MAAQRTTKRQLLGTDGSRSDIVSRDRGRADSLYDHGDCMEQRAAQAGTRTHRGTAY